MIQSKETGAQLSIPAEIRETTIIFIPQDHLRPIAKGVLEDTFSDRLIRVNMIMPKDLLGAASESDYVTSQTIRDFNMIRGIVETVRIRKFQLGQVDDLRVGDRPMALESALQQYTCQSVRYNFILPQWERDIVTAIGKKQGLNFSSFTRQALAFGLNALQGARSQGYPHTIPISVGNTHIAFIK